MPEEPKAEGAVQTITADKLCVLTGLTDRRHHQIADEGYFPKPNRGEYALVPTIQGLFRYYRELSQKAKSKLVELNESKAESESKILRLKLAKEEKKSVDKSEVNALFLHVSTLQKTILYTKLERELAGRTVGRTAGEISAVGRSVADELAEIFTSEVAKWNEEE